MKAVGPAVEIFAVTAAVISAVVTVVGLTAGPVTSIMQLLFGYFIIDYLSSTN